MKALENLPNPANQQEVNTWLIANMTQMKEKIKSIEDKIEPAFVKDIVWKVMRSDESESFMEKKIDEWWRKKVFRLFGKLIPITAIIQALISYALMKFI